MLSNNISDVDIDGIDVDVCCCCVDKSVVDTARSMVVGAIMALKCNKKWEEKKPSDYFVILINLVACGCSLSVTS